MPYDLHVYQIPTLLFQPANSQLFTNKIADSILYEYKNDFSISSLVNFVLNNSRNPKTLIDFLKSNSHQLKNNLNEILAKKIIDLESKTYFLNKKVHFLYNESSRIDMKESNSEDDENSHHSELLQNSNNNDELMNYKRIYLNEMNSVISNKIDNYLVQISHLKNMKNYFND